MITINEELRKEALDYMEENRLSKASLAEKLDVHRTSVSQYFTGNNDGLAQVTVDKIEKALTDIIGFSEEKSIQKSVRRGTALCETRDSLGIMAVCQSCQDYMGMGIIAGRSGFGKTFTLKFYAAPIVFGAAQHYVFFMSQSFSKYRISLSQKSHSCSIPGASRQVMAAPSSVSFL